MYLYYTANRYLKEQDENIHVADGEYEESQAMIASEDGFHFDNWNGKKQIIPVIRDDETADSMDTRDPESMGRKWRLLYDSWQYIQT